ncbi:MAG: hypothetical protein AB1578_18135 [Thermodesulfobacteriota bacterium]
MGASQRRKGREGQCQARHLLEDRDWSVLELKAGVRSEDLVVEDPHGRRYSLECKKQKVVDLPRFLAQARAQAKTRKLPWALLAHLHGTSSWLFVRQGERPTVWHSAKEATS